MLPSGSPPRQQPQPPPLPRYPPPNTSTTLSFTPEETVSPPKDPVERTRIAKQRVSPRITISLSNVVGNVKEARHCPQPPPPPALLPFLSKITPTRLRIVDHCTIRGIMLLRMSHDPPQPPHQRGRRTAMDGAFHG
ncbi:hypothetical protein M378DRAFT_13817 [Amanita muscaria Koide BX008]|uniref:Uncharacterized protein n=1 Tax=Amanita muscaria (strain Koide BX008) TaxID=946122 RepID=A0A0C2T315_AMAMK|nr:hypothetical protein M378DRAFT_13817 [Amanita muscaria Koide BX008]